MTSDPAVDEELLDERFPQIAWDRERPERSLGFMDRYSVQHRYKGQSDDYTLCGSRIPWMYISPGDARRCRRCEKIARAKLAAEPEDLR